MSKENIKKVPKGALRFVEQGFHAFAEGSEGEQKRLKMTAYNGHVIKGHWYWGDLAIDVSGIRFASKKFPILENHDTSRKIGFHDGRPDTSNNKLELLPEKTKFVDTECAKEFVRLSGEGFPYQASIYAQPTKVLRLGEDETANVNGFEMKGPGSVWRECVFKEASVCVFGWDSETNSSAFSHDITEDVEFEEEERAAKFTDDSTEGGDNKMDLQELKDKHPELVQQLSSEVENSLKTKFDEEKKKLSDENARLNAQLSDSDKRLAELEKRDAIRTESERRASAEKIVDTKLSDSEVGDHLWDKVKGMIDYRKFVKDDAFDVEAFAKAVDEEITDWESRLSSVPMTGLGVVGRKADGNEKTPAANKEENEKFTNDLLARAGQKTA